MKVVVIGTGYVGLVSGACLAHIGNHVVCVDKDARKIEMLNNGDIPIYEPGLKEIVERNTKEGRLSFTLELNEALKNADCVLLAVGTPTDERDGSADLSYVYAAAKEIAEQLEHDICVVTKSTVPVGTGDHVSEIFKKTRPDLNCEIVSNPEFLREGVAVDDFLKPDRIIVGASSEKGKTVMQAIYQPLIGQGYPILFTNIPTAELIKYASNAFLATKIAFANEMANICEGTGADIDLVIKGMGMDQRIGGQYMKPGPGFGGSCFPKDTLALTDIARKAGAPCKIVEAVVQSNDARKVQMVDKIVAALDGEVVNKNVAILGLTFKANTDDMRYSPSLVIIPELLKRGASVRVYDPVGMEEAKKLLPVDALCWCDSVEDVVSDADVVVIVTEWEEFADLPLARLRAVVRNPVMVDLRNLYAPKSVEKDGFKYLSVGREFK